jgi:hypothetical protein
VIGPFGCGRAERALERWFVRGALPRRSQTALWTHLGRCARCRARFDRLALAWRALPTFYGGVDGPRDIEILPFVERVLPPRPVADRVPLHAWWAALATAGLVALLLLAGLWGVPRRESSFVARDAGDGVLVLRAYCRTEDTAGRPLIRPLGEEANPAAVAECPQSGVLLFSWQCRDAGRLVLVNERRDGARWLTADDGLLLAAARAATPLPVTAVGGADAGEVVALFCREPVGTAGCDAALLRLAAWRRGEGQGSAAAWEAMARALAPPVVVVRRRLGAGDGDDQGK